MSTYITAAVVVGFLLLMIRSARPRRRTRSGQSGRTRAHVFDSLSRYREGLWSALILGTLALHSVLSWSPFRGMPIDAAAASLGIMCAICTVLGPPGIRLRELVLGTLGAFAATAGAYSFLREPDPVAAELALAYRAALMVLLTACFVLGSLRIRLWRTLNPAKGLVLFAIMDIVTFMAGPGGARLYELTPTRHWFYLGVVCVTSFLLGLGALEIVIALAAAAVGLVAFFFDGTPATGVIMVVCALVPAAAIILLSAPFSRRLS